METEVEVLQIDTSKGQQSIAGLRKEIKQLKDQLVGLEEGTKEYNDVLVEVADKTHQLKEIQEQVRKSSQDFGDQLANVRGTITGVSGAFQTVLGSLSLMGVELGDDVKMLKMLQSAMAITQGVAAIDSGIKSFKALSISIKAATAATNGFKKALIATGIGALVVAVGLLIANMDKLSQLFGGAADESDKFAAANKRLKESLDSLNQQTELEIAMMEQDGATKVEVARKRLEAARAALAEADATVDLIRAKGELNKKELEELQTAMDVANERWKIVTKANQDLFLAERQAQLDRQKAERERVQKHLEELRKQNEEAAKQRLADLKKIAEQDNEANMSLVGDEQAELTKLKIAYDEALELHKKYGQDTAAITEAYEKQVAEITERYRKERAERLMDGADLEAETEYQMQRAAVIIANEENIEEQLLQLDMDFRDRREELVRERYEQGLLTTEEFNSQIAALEVEAANLQIEQEQRVTEKTKTELEKRKKMQQNYQKAIGSIVGSIGKILSSIGGVLEQGSSEWKAVMTAEAIISTIKGGIDAYMGMIAAIPGPYGIAAGAAAAIATVAAGMAEVAKIQSTDISTGGGGSSTSSNTSLGSVSPSAVQVAATQVTNTRQTSTTTDIEELPEQRVYVLESDITDAQNNVRTTVRQATF